MNDVKRYGALLKSAIDQHGMTAKEFADSVGWSQSVVSDLINGKRTVVPPETVRTVWLTLSVPVRSQLVALGYVTEDEPEPGVAYVIREDDPRAEVLRVLEGRADSKVRAAANLLRVAALWSGDDALMGGQDDRSVTG